MPPSGKPVLQACKTGESSPAVPREAFLLLSDSLPFLETWNAVWTDMAIWGIFNLKGRLGIGVSNVAYTRIAS